jgi:hypothetical protein
LHLAIFESQRVDLLGLRLISTFHGHYSTVGCSRLACELRHVSYCDPINNWDHAS